MVANRARAMGSTFLANPHRREKLAMEPLVVSVYFERSLLIGQRQAHLGTSGEVGGDDRFVKPHVSLNDRIQRLVGRLFDGKTDQDCNPLPILLELSHFVELPFGQDPWGDVEALRGIVFEIDPQGALIVTGDHGDGEPGFVGDRADQAAGHNRGTARRL